VLSLLQSIFHSNGLSSLIILMFCAVAWMGIQRLGYAEFSLAGKLLFRGDLQRTLKAQLDLTTFRKAIEESRSADVCAELVHTTAAGFGFEMVQASLANETFTWPRTAGPARWEVRITLDEGDFVEMRRNFESADLSATTGLFLDVLRTGLERRLPGLRLARMKARQVAIPDSRHASV
jgi:hypothetical protein